MNQKWYLTFIFLFSLFCVSFSEVSISFSSNDNKSLNIKWINSSINSYYLGGCRFYTNSYTFQFTDAYWNYNTIDKADQKEHTLLYANLTNPFIEVPPQNGSFSAASNIDWSGKQIEIPSKSTILLKTGSSGFIEQPKDEDPITIDQIDSLLATPNFYNSNYRYIDTLGARGGINSGGIMDTWLGETQVITHFSDSSWTLHGSEKASFDLSKTNGDPLYWMTVIMGQEYFQVDMQWMLGKGAQETGAGAATYNGTNKEGAFGPWEIETGTGKSRESAYPYLFQKGTISDFWDETYAQIDEALVVNGYIYSIVAVRYLYDLLMYAEDACWLEILTNSASRYYPLSILLGGYNNGIGDMQVVLNPFWHVNTYETYYLDPDGHNIVEAAMKKGYVPGIIEGVKNLENGSKAASADLNLPLINMDLSLTDIKRFFYGEGGTANSQGIGGLLTHFDVNRNEFNDLIESAFDKLKGKAPSTQGEDMISLRYDFLTILRVVKSYFKFNWSRPTTSEWSTFVTNFSKTGGCSGLSIDNVYPYTDISKPILSTDGSNYTIQIEAKDDIAIKKVEWTIDSNWVNWEKTEFLSGDDSLKNFQFKVTKSFAENSGANTSLPITVWISTTDNSYNSTVDTFSIDFNPVSTQHSKEMENQSQNILINKNAIQIPSNLFKNNQKVRLSIYNSQGKKVYYKIISSGNQKVNLNELRISSGIYYMKMSSNIDTKSVRFQKH